MRSMKRPLSILLSLVLIFSMFTIIPVTAAAQDIGEDESLAPTAAARDAALAQTGAPAELAPTGANYGIVVGSRVITPDNCSDVFGNGSVRYDSTQKILTLNNPVITDIYNNNENFGAIQIQTDGVTLRGTYHMSEPLSKVGLKVSDGNHVTMEGDFTFRGRSIGIVANDLTINSGSVTAVSTGSEVSACGIYSENFVVNGGITRVDIQAPYCAYIGDKLTMNQTRLQDDAFFFPDERAILKADMNTYTTHAVIEKFTGTYYDLWLGTRHVDSRNCSDIYGDGKASFDPISKVLTLNDPEIVGVYAFPTETLDSNAKIYTGYDLTVRGSYAMGTGTLLTTKASPFHPVYLQNGIYSAKSLRFEGSFSFTAADKAVYGSTGVTVGSGTLTADSTDNCAVYCDTGTFTVSNDVETVDIQGNWFCALAPSIEIGDRMTISYPVRGSVIAAPNTSFKTIGFYVGAKALRAVIGTMPENPSQLGLEGKGTESAPYLITSAAEWDKLVFFIDYYNGSTEGMYFKLMNPITVSTVLGTKTNPFKGSFDGGGNTLTLDIAVSKEEQSFVAPFSHVSDATIRNLRVDGNLKGSIHCSGLIGATDGGVNLIENVEVAVAIESLSQYCGGFVGHGCTAQTIFRSCVYSGSIKCGGGRKCADMYGWSDGGSKVAFENCFDLAYVEYPIGRGDAEFTIENTYYIHMDKDTGGDRAWGNTGKRAYTITGSGVELTLEGTPGLYYGGMIYAGAGETVTLTASEDGVLYTNDWGTLTQNGRHLILNMKANNTTISPSGDVYYTDYSHAESASGYDGETADKLVDGDPDTKWRGSNADTTPVMTFRTAGGFIPSGYLLTTAADAADHPGRNPIAWTLEASANGMDWTVLDDVSENTTLGAENKKTYAFALHASDTAAYLYFRFTINDVAGGTTFQLSELQLVGREAGYVGESYPIWVGGTQVKTENMNDILNDGGKAQYDPITHVLTLNDPVIADYYQGPFSTAKIFFEYIDVTVKGSYHMEDEGLTFGLYSSSQCYRMTLDGDFTFYGEYGGVYCGDGAVTVVSGSLTSISAQSVGLYSRYCLTLQDGVKRVEAKSEAGNYAIWLYNTNYGGLVMDEHLIVSEPEGAQPYYVDSSFWFQNPDGSCPERVVIERAKYTVTFDANGHGTAPESQQVTYGDPVVAPEAPAVEGWTFGGWYTEPECRTAYDLTAGVDGALNLYAKWSRNEYEVSFETNGGEGGMESISVLHGDELVLPECTLTAPANMMFDRWDKGAAGDKITVTADTVIKPLWKKRPYIVGDADGDGEVSILDATAIQRTLAKLPTTSYNEEAADADEDGDITILDATAIQRYLAKLSANPRIGRLVS